MPIPSYLQDEDDVEQALPFLNSSDADQDGAVQQQTSPSPQLLVSGGTPPPPKSPAPPTTVTPEMQRIWNAGQIAPLNGPSAAGLNFTPVPGSMRQNNVVTPEARRIFGVAPVNTASAAPPSTPDPVKAYQDAVARRAEVVQARPPIPQPKWWQRALAGVAGAAMGAGAGYLNSSGKRIAPIDPSAGIQAVGELITAPGQRRSDAQWWNRVQAADADVAAKKDALDTAIKTGTVDTPENLFKAAQAGQANAVAAYDLHRSESERNRFRDTRAGVLDTQTGQIITAPKSDVDKMNDRNAYAAQQGWTEETHPGVTQWIAQGKWGTSPKPESRSRNLVSVAPGHTLVDQDTNKPVYTAPDRTNGPKPAAPAQFRQVEANKNRRFDAARAAWEKDKTAINAQYGSTPPTDPVAQQSWQQARQAAQQEADNKYRTAQREALDAYNGELTAIGGAPTVFDIEWKEDAGGERSDASQSGGGTGSRQVPTTGGGQVFPRARLAAFATANGMTPTEAEAQLKQQGYTVK